MPTKINFAWPTTSEHSMILQYLIDKISSIKNQLEGVKIIIFGVGIRGCTVASVLEKIGLNNIMFCDNNMEKQGHLINTYNIISLNEAMNLDEKKCF